MKRLQLHPDTRERLEELDGLLDRHVQHFRDVFSAEVNIQRLAVVARSVTDLTRHLYVGQELHLDLDITLALAGLAAAALDIEGEAAGLVAAQPRFRDRREHLAYRREGAGVGGWVRAGRAADRRLVVHDYLVELFEDLDGDAYARTFLRSVKMYRVILRVVVDSDYMRYLY